jgi:hypothetical protein
MQTVYSFAKSQVNSLVWPQFLPSYHFEYFQPQRGFHYQADQKPINEDQNLTDWCINSNLYCYFLLSIHQKEFKPNLKTVIWLPSSLTIEPECSLSTIRHDLNPFSPSFLRIFFPKNHLCAIIWSCYQFPRVCFLRSSLIKVWFAHDMSSVQLNV